MKIMHTLYSRCMHQRVLNQRICWNFIVNINIRMDTFQTNISQYKHTGKYKVESDLEYTNLLHCFNELELYNTAGMADGVRTMQRLFFTQKQVRTMLIEIRLGAWL